MLKNAYKNVLLFLTSPHRTSLFVCSLLLLLVALSSWSLALRYRGASDFTDTLGYMAQAKYLSNDRQFYPTRISWEGFVNGTHNLHTPASYPGQFFSLGVGWFAKILGLPLEMWVVLLFNFCVYVLCCILCMSFLARHVRGWEFLLIGFFSLTNYFVMSACVSTLTDCLGFALLLLALWFSTLNKKRHFIIGIIFGVSLFVRAHLTIFALFFPLLLFEKWSKRVVPCTLLYIFGIVCAYGCGYGFLKCYVVPQPPPFSVMQYAQTREMPFVVPEDTPNNQEQDQSHATKKSFSTLGWYSRQIYASLPTLREYGVGWMTLGAYQTLGPASWCFGPLFFLVVVSLLFRWSNPIILRYSLYLVCTLGTFYCAAYMLLIPGPTEIMIDEFKTLGRYFCYFFPLLPLLVWFIIKELISPETKFFAFLEGIKQKIFGQTLDSRLVATGILFCCVFPTNIAFWGYGAALLAKVPVRQGPIVFQGDRTLRHELATLTANSMVMSSRCDAVQVFSDVRHVVQSPTTPDQFLQNKNNHLLDALVLFPHAMGATIKITDSEIEAWQEELKKDLIVDEQGNQFIKVCTHHGEGADTDMETRRAFMIYRRVGSPGFDSEQSPDITK